MSHRFFRFLVYSRVTKVQLIITAGISLIFVIFCWWFFSSFLQNPPLNPHRSQIMYIAVGIAIILFLFVSNGLLFFTVPHVVDGRNLGRNDTAFGFLSLAMAGNFLFILFELYHTPSLSFIFVPICFTLVGLISCFFMRIGK